MKINNIELKEAHTDAERKLLGALNEIAENIQYGDIQIDITVSRGHIKKMNIVNNKRVVLLD